MYEAFFGLKTRPFSAAPRADQYVPTSTVESARQKLLRTIERAEGAGLVVGPSGTGKTLLCRVLAEQCRGRFEVPLLASGRLSTRRSLLQALLYEMHRPYRGLDEGELRLALVDHLMHGEDESRGVVLLVDEAHTLPLRLLEELRLLTNLVRDGQLRVRMVLAGDPQLEERFASPKLESFSQRLVARCYLEALNGTETQQYIEGQLREAGASAAPVITPEAALKAFQATGGVPRLVNQVCDHALVLAFSAGERSVGPARIEEAWADLQQLPPPAGDARDPKPAGSVIEFGRLDEGPADSAGEPEPAGAAPALRVAATPCDAEAEPPDRIASIQRSLESTEEDFKPAGTIGPEVELVFHDWGNPFEERFEEEELVAERHKPEPEQQVERTVQMLASAVHDAAVPGPAAPAEAAEPEPPADRWQADEATVPLRRASPTAAVELQEEAVLVVDDDGVEPLEGPATVVVRRHQYRQLFARLRRSG